MLSLSLIVIPALLLTGFSPFRWHSDRKTVRVHVTLEGIDAKNAAVSLHTEDEIPLGRSTAADRRGRAEFRVRQDACMFRIDYGGKVYWSDMVSFHSKKEKHVHLPLESLWRDLTTGAPPDKNDDIAEQTPPRTQRIYYFINDHMGRPLMVTDEERNVVWEAEPLPFGETRVREGATVENNLRFPGQYFDQETGLHYNYHRYYDPNIGRYLRPDPIGLKGGNGIYCYALNNPLNWSDPYGMWTFTYSGGVHLPRGFLMAEGISLKSELIKPFDASGRLIGRGAKLEATLGIFADLGLNAGIGDLSGTGNQAGETISLGSGKYGGVQFVLRNDFDPFMPWYNPLKYLDGISVGLGLGLGLPASYTIPVDPCEK